MEKVIIGSRGSRLALTQSNTVCDSIRASFPDLEVEVQTIVTRGDRDQTTPLPKIGDKGLFTLEIEAGLLDDSIQLAVHSCKDLPTELPPGLGIGAIPKRVPREDVIISTSGKSLLDLPAGSRIGSGSLRRVAQIHHLRPDLMPLPIRGNVDTRIRKLDEGQYDAIILARAGLERLGLTDRISADLPPDRWYYAVSQGAVAIECRHGNDALLDLLLALNHAASWKEVRAERAFLKAIGGGCRTPTGVRTELTSNGRIILEGMVASLDGSIFLEAKAAGPQTDPQSVGRQLATALFKQGAGDVLKANLETMNE